MSSLVLVAFVGFVAFGWVRAVRRNRARWLRKLALPGTWLCESGELQTAFHQRFVFNGSPRGGEYYCLNDQAHKSQFRVVEQGAWTVRADALVLEPANGAQRQYTLRYFGPGQIGLTTARGQGMLLEKSGDNVVPLNRNASH